MSGVIQDLQSVPDEVFASKMLGDGFAIEPSEGSVIAPMDGIVEMIFSTKHSIGIKGNNGVSLLIHIGIDTVELNGKGFTLLVEKGQQIHQGDVLMEVDLAYIKAKEKETISMFVFTQQEEIKVHRTNVYIQQKDANFLSILRP